MSPMARALPGFITHPLLSELGVEHGFGTRAAQAPEGLVRPHQVHGHTVIRAKRGQARDPLDADAVVSDDPALPVGIITADCVPILVASCWGAAGAAGGGVAWGAAGAPDVVPAQLILIPKTGEKSTAP